ncbi:MAG TPA: hypothetical protein VI456_10600 [Polyangia bacterium]
MKTKNLLLAPVLGALATAVSAPAAHAQTTTAEYVVILLDETGSMCTDSIPCAPATNSFWLNALDDAKLWVNQDSGSTNVPRFYSIWTFKDTQDGVQTNAVQLWPTTSFNAGCNDTHATIDPAGSGFCALKVNDPTPYVHLQTTIDSIKTMAGQIPQPTWLTPLADAVCRSLSAVWASQTNVSRTVILETDGGENDSMLACLGPPDGNSPTILNTQLSDWGYTVGSWEANTYRRAARLPSFDSLGSDGTFAGAEASAVGQGPLTSADSLPPQLGFKVSINYSLCSTNTSDPACPAPITPMVAMAQSNLVAAPSNFGARFDGDATADVHAAKVQAFALQAAPAATTATTTQTTSVDPNELAYFRLLGKATKRSKGREVVRDPSVVFGVTHKLAGDVDDSGCVDHADFSEVTQSDIWMQRAVLPLQLAIRADLNRDGWVNEQDRAIVLANWGKGCINNPGPKPVIPQ